MNKPQNVLELELLMQSYYSADMLISSDMSPEHKEGLHRLLKAELVVLNNNRARATVKGHFYVNHLLDQPYPEVSYKIPGA